MTNDNTFQNIAVILTVYNRCEVTIKGLRLLKFCIDNLHGHFMVDIFMTDDGSNDGTYDAVTKEFPDVNIIKGDGNLFWSGGMRKAWRAAIDTKKKYDYYLWYNDDAELYPTALTTLLNAMHSIGNVGIITGAFKDTNGKVSYGAWDKKMKLISPNGKLQNAFLINGNLVLVSKEVVAKIGIIDRIFKHSLGDWDYGRRASRAGFKVMLSDKYVGVTDRHDTTDLKMYNPKYSLIERWRFKHQSRDSQKASFIYNKRHDGIMIAVMRFIVPYLYVIFPFIYKLKHY